MAWTASQQRPPQPALRLDVNGNDLVPFTVSWRYRWPWHGKATWNLSAWWTPDNRNWSSVPSDFALPGYGDFAGLLRHHDFGASRVLNYGLNVAGMPFQAPKLLPSSPAFDGILLDWPGSDYTAVLEKPGATFPDILMDKGMLVSAHSAMKDMAASVGVKVECRFPNFTIRILRRARGRILDYLDAIGRVHQCGRRWQGNVLIYEPAKTNQTPFRKFDGNLNMAAWAVEETYDGLANQFRVTRFEPVSGVIGELEVRGGGAVGGPQVVQFDPPSRTAYPEIKTNLDLQNWVFDDEAGNPLPGAGGAIYVGATPAKQARFTGVPITPSSVVPPGFGGPQGDATGAYTPYFEVVFTGGGRGTGAAYDSQYSFTADDTATQAIYGVLPDETNIEDPIYPTAQVAQSAVNAVKNEAVRHLYRGILRTHYLDPFIYPGCCVSVTDYMTRYTGSLWFVEAVLHDLNPDGSWGMGLELTKGL